MKIVNQQIAKLAGLRHYFTGKSCKRGHVVKRYVSDGGCVECGLERNRRQYEDPNYREQYNARQRILWQKHRENPVYCEWDKARKRKRKGLPEPTYPEPTNCEMCGVLAENLNRGLCLDHDHGAGKFRGWLCVKCNSGLGLLGDTLPALQRAIEYLRRAQ